PDTRAAVARHRQTCSAQANAYQVAPATWPGTTRPETCVLAPAPARCAGTVPLRRDRRWGRCARRTRLRALARRGRRPLRASAIPHAHGTWQRLLGPRGARRLIDSGSIGLPHGDGRAARSAREARGTTGEPFPSPRALAARPPSLDRDPLA